MHATACTDDLSDEVTSFVIKGVSDTVDFTLDSMHVTAGDSATQSVPDNVRQWLQLIRDENSLSSQDFLSTSDTDTSTISQNTLHTQDEVESVITANCSKASAREHSDAADGDKNLTGSLGDDVRQYTLNHSIYQELALGNE